MPITLFDSDKMVRLCLHLKEKLWHKDIYTDL